MAISIIYNTENKDIKIKPIFLLKMILRQYNPKSPYEIKKIRVSE